jgi:NtrC-family two-component system response regulator AlgB
MAQCSHAEVMTSTSPAQVLIIDSDARRRPAIMARVRRMGLLPRMTESLSGATLLIGETLFKAVLIAREQAIEQQAMAMTGLLCADPTLPVFVIDGNPSPEMAVYCLKHGASGYVPFPARRGALHKLLVPKRSPKDVHGSAWAKMVLTRSSLMRRLLGEGRRAALTSIPILIRGETGTGKGLLARAIHEVGNRRSDRFVTVDCANLGSERLMSDLFGHVRGAFTDACHDYPGKVTLAAGGTLLLDEVGELPRTVQAMLLRFLQDQTYERVGDPRARTGDVRIIATSSRDLSQLLQKGHFREDLYYRLAVIDLELPPLRERSEDIEFIAQSLLDGGLLDGGLLDGGRVVNNERRTLTADCLASLRAHPWPGNVHELDNEIRRAALLSTNREITAADLTTRVRSLPGEVPRLGGPFALQAIADEHIRRVVELSPTLERAAAVLGIQSSTLWRRRCLLRNAGGAS